MKTTVKERLNTAFKMMRANGLIARQGFSCCRSCAGAAIAGEVGKMTEAKRARIVGVASYTRQDAESMFDCSRLGQGKFTGVYIGYGPVEVSGLGTFGMPTVAVGKIVATSLTLAGLAFDWDGKPESRIFVTGTAPEAVVAESAAERLSTAVDYSSLAAVL